MTTTVPAEASGEGSRTTWMGIPCGERPVGWCTCCCRRSDRRRHGRSRECGTRAGIVPPRSSPPTTSCGRSSQVRARSPWSGSVPNPAGPRSTSRRSSKVVATGSCRCTRARPRCSASASTRRCGTSRTTSRSTSSTCSAERSETPEVARDAVAIGASALWLQQDIVNEEAGRIAADGGLDRHHGYLHQADDHAARRRCTRPRTRRYDHDARGSTSWHRCLEHNPGEILNTFGQDGWELVSVVAQPTPSGATSTVAYLKRPGGLAGPAQAPAGREPHPQAHSQCDRGARSRPGVTRARVHPTARQRGHRRRRRGGAPSATGVDADADGAARRRAHRPDRVRGGDVQQSVRPEGARRSRPAGSVATSSTSPRSRSSRSESPEPAVERPEVQVAVDDRAAGDGDRVREHDDRSEKSPPPARPVTRASRSWRPASIRFTSSSTSGPFSVSHRSPVAGSTHSPNELR